MELTNKKIGENQSNLNSEPDGTATHSGWTHFYNSFSRYRDECIILGKEVLGNNLQMAINCLSSYHSALYSMAQQIFSFYDSKVEDELTNQWLVIGDKVNDYITKISDKDFRKQMNMDGEVSIDRILKIELLKYFNKVDRMAAEAGLLVGQENKGAIEPKKGLVGFTK